MDCRRPALDLLQSTYTTLATQSSLDNLTMEVREKITEWSMLTIRAQEQLTILCSVRDQWRAFSKKQAAAVCALVDIDAKLTQVDLLPEQDQSDLNMCKNKLKKLVVSAFLNIHEGSKMVFYKPFHVLSNTSL